MAHLDIKYTANIESLRGYVIWVWSLKERGGLCNVCVRVYFVGGSSIMYKDD